ncbi:MULTISPECIES: TetR/AcrR family transcriptional regulator [Actinoplanes]|uniref:TetR/AcrR family transcriptional regulator n=1 Tax=Actinoplanes TaxID=1865 RepID=UPI0005F2F5AD|nr:MULTISPECIES: TetR/AcrR family transcriptional regulator [Actinoplanes]GLY06870.1 hypothetical protein Acsp01_72490 [Actinoplanes sp. NBRC 101535]
MPKTGRPPATSRAQILDAARRIIDDDGWERLTVRRLAGDLGIGTTTLYHHVRDREDLLILLINEHAGRTMTGELPTDPAERVFAAAVAIHDSLASWPWAAEVLSTDGFLGRLEGAALSTVEALLTGAVDHGCTPEQAAHVFRAVWYYTVGEILVRAHSSGRPPVPPTFAAPQLAGLGERWPELAATDTYRQGLRTLVTGLLTS